MSRHFNKIMLVRASLILVVLSLLISSCAPAATAEPAKPTDAPVETPLPPTEKPAPDPVEPKGETVSAGGGVLESPTDREMNPDVSIEDLLGFSQGNTDFALALYQALKDEGGNLFYSPYSISAALAMAYAGARGETEAQISDVLRFYLPQDQLHPAFNALDLALAGRAEIPELEDTEGFRLNIANALWGQVDYPFLQDYVDLLALNYGAGLRLKDFSGDPEGSRQDINDWVSEKTEDRIKDLIPEGGISNLTRLVLTNAIYFNASWLFTFNEDLTQDAQFTLLDGSQVTVLMMALTDPKSFQYAEGDGFQIVELPYIGNQLGMTIILPDEGAFQDVEARLTGDEIRAALASMQPAILNLQMPKFEYEAELSLAETLAAMGMPDAFDPASADFSGMDGTRDLSVSGIFHKAFVAVDEEGTEAAAATALVIGLTSIVIPDQELTIDRPFIFMIRDIETNSILFVGRVLNPTGS